MGDAFELADDLGPEKVLYLHDPATGLRAILVIDNVAAGPAIGGTRMAPDVSLAECARLARAMTLKNAAAGLPHGGAKAVIFADPGMPAGDKERLVRAYAYALKDVRDYIVGPDMGTDETAMAWVHDVIGRSVGLPREIGGIPLDEIGATGFGLAVALEAAEPFAALPLAGARVAIQGFGAVGMNAARFLVERGARLVAASDSAGSLTRAEGLDVPALVDWKRQGGRLAEFPGGGGARGIRSSTPSATSGFRRHGPTSSTRATWTGCGPGWWRRGPTSRSPRRRSGGSPSAACWCCRTSSSTPAE